MSATNNLRQKRFAATHAKVMLPKEVKSILDSKARLLGLTSAKLIEVMVNSDHVVLGLTVAEEYLNLSTPEIIARLGSKQAVSEVIKGLPEFERRTVAECKTEAGRKLAQLLMRVNMYTLKKDYGNNQRSADLHEQYSLF